MDTNEHASSIPGVVPSKDVASAWLSGYRGLKTLGPGAVAHMSLHLKLTISKSQPTKRGQQDDPRFAPGDRLSDNVGDRCDRSQV
jgi:hypothetical protein